ncbi:Conserved_hypothetical protein [Hexamita inflata]|uniref:Uncharacterized protein n=1 Tax=Hexamita inflata TaxID=28002 RepID=A0AA86ULB6_9EUKA|nr:Conserved hypothetical protein [Hexamita inflata]
MFNSRIDFCSKILELNNKQISDNIYVSKQFTNVNIFFQNTKTQNALIDIQVHNFNVNEFTLFGMSVNGHTVKESQINITLKFEVVSGALICIICDLHVYNSSLVFVATGHKISGVILEALSYIEIELTFIQFRITSKYSSGIVSLVNKSDLNLTIIDSRLAGSNLLSSEDSGYIAVAVLSTMTVSLNTFYICVNNISRFGLINATVTDHGSEMARCDVCGIQTVVYGLCADSLDHATLANGTLQCMFPFEFVDNSCVCAYGHMLNGSDCVNIIYAINIANITVQNQDQTLLKQVQQMVSYCQSQEQIQDNNIQNNFSGLSGVLNSSYSNLEQFIKNNFSLADTNLLSNTTVLDQQIFDNIFLLTADINNNFSTYETFIVSNATTLDWRIFYNVSFLNQSILDINNTLLLLKSKYYNLSQQIACSSTYGYSYINGSCEQIQCPINGQQSINGVCQCAINAVINKGQCECPYGSKIIGFECTCETGLPIQSGICGCSTPGAFVQAGSCTCGINSLNVSNVCSCPSGSTLQAGECKCTNVNAYMSGSSCVCPTFSTLIGSTCTCPANSALIGNTCVCNQIAEQTMMAGACQCTTSGAFVNSSVCTCGVDSLNISNSCSCPINSTLVAGACTCNVISGQVMNTGTCQCSTSGAIIDAGSCSCGINGLNISNQCGCPENSTLVGNTCTCTVNAGESMQAGICKCTTSGAFVQAGSCTCGINSLNVSNVCSCPTNSILIEGKCICNVIFGQIIDAGICTCPTDQSVLNGVCQKLVVVNSSDSTLQCTFGMYVAIFDLQTSKTSISQQNFSSGYVFSSSSIIKNAFLDIADNVYNTITEPLFQYQSTFINLKIQFGTQTISSGSFLQEDISIIISNMIILSKSSCQMIVNSAQQLNILTSSSTTVNISNLQVNLTFTPSSGNITLINNINGVLNITGYQVLGIYVSSQTVAMIGNNINIATIDVNLITFKPSAYNVGNWSSYLFGNDGTTQSSFSINNLAVILGNNSDLLLLGSISTTTTNNYLFGGIVAYIKSNSTISVNNVLVNSYQHFSSSYVSYSGFLLGYVKQSSSRVSIKFVCLQQKVTSTTLKFTYFGLLGITNANTSLQNASIIFYVQGAFTMNFGIIGVQSNSSFNTEILNVVAVVSVMGSNASGCVGSLFGQQNAQNGSIINVSVLNGTLDAFSSFIGGLIGQQQNSVFIINSSVSQVNISASSTTGGFIGDSAFSVQIINCTVSRTNVSGASFVGGCFGRSSTLSATKLRIQFTRVSGSFSVGLVTGSNTGTQNFTNSSSSSNFVKNVSTTDCPVLSNSWSTTGC